MSTEAQKEVRRIFGRGFAAGLAAAQTKDEAMNAARLAELENGITAAAKKVLDVVPITEAWAGKQIHLELTRQGRSVDRSHVDGCLQSLKERGLVREPDVGMWIRVSAKPKPKPNLSSVPPVNPSIMAQADAAEKAATDPLDRLAALAQSLRDLSKMANNLANEIEAAALDVDARIQAASADGAKLRQLQALLKGLE